MDRMAEIDALVEENRATCLWFFDAAFRPDTPAKAMQALDSIVRYGSRDAFIRASELKAWLAHEPDRAPAAVLPTMGAGPILPSRNR
jgi:hypothetical protein